MEWHEIASNGQHIVNISEKLLATNGNSEYKQIGGIIRNGECAWTASGCKLIIVSLRNGQTISTFNFADLKGFDECYIKHVAEICPNSRDNIMLAICLESLLHNKSDCNYVGLFSVEHCNVLSCIELRMKISSVSFVDPSVCHGSLFQNFDGCLAVGTEDGSIMLINLNAQMLSSSEAQFEGNIFKICNTMEYDQPLSDIRRCFQYSQTMGEHFGIILEKLEGYCSVQCICPIKLILGLAVGLEDGRLILYDLAELQIFYIAEPEHPSEMSSTVKINYLEPSDDPRSCLYLFVVFESEKSLTATLHLLAYEKRCLLPNDSIYFENFQSCSKRLRLPLEHGKCETISCQTVARRAANGDGDADCLCALTWYSITDEKNKLVFFDLNQWYKDEMPFMLDDNRSNYLAGYILSANRCALDGFLHPSTITYFNSVQRADEHFYPNSLIFEFSLLLPNSCIRYNWVGVQNMLINRLRCSNASLFLEPDRLCEEIHRTCLIPQFMDTRRILLISKEAKYELLLSVALENNCYSLLRDCARCWADGSFMGKAPASSGISLSTLTNWIWKRANSIKTHCNEMCKTLFGCDTYPIDQREQKELSVLTRQLQLLVNLFQELLSYSKQIPTEVFARLQKEYKLLLMSLEYQDIILWLINIGLLPESQSALKVYPYSELKAFYVKKRKYFANINEKFVSKQTGYCRLMYIDSLIQHKCKDFVLQDDWRANGGDGLYPPNSIESMLRVLLVPELDFESKCAILLYFFLDLHMAFDEGASHHIVSNFIKFPSVFKMSASMVKTVQTFWNLDHDHFLASVDEFISPFNKNQNHSQWTIELLIEALILQNVPNLALRVLEAYNTSIPPVLQLKTLLSNNLISEAFHLTRAQHDKSLLELFFSCCLCSGNFGVIRDLALSEKEGQLLQRILKENKTFGAESLHFVYLLQKSKYIEAVTYMDELSKSKCTRSNFSNSIYSDTPNLVLSAFNTTMTPVTQGLTDVYFRIKNKIKKKETDNKSPVPLSCQLIKQNANNLLGGIYHSSALSAHFATYYWGEMDNKSGDAGLLNSNNAPFLRKPQTGVHYCDYLEKNKLYYPQAYKTTDKRKLLESDIIATADEIDGQSTQENPKKRRRLLGQEIFEDLSHFAEINKNSGLSNTTGFSFGTVEPSQTNAPDVTGMYTKLPVAKSPTLQPTHFGNISSGLHSILRNTNSSEQGNRSSIRREFGVDEEKNIRFNLPDEDTEDDDSRPQSPRNSNESNVKKHEAQVNEESEPEPKLKHKLIARTVSIDSIGSDDGSKDNTEEGYYSPLHSLNTSSVIPQEFVPSSPKVKHLEEKTSPHSGPRPRKPLQRFSEGHFERRNFTAQPCVEATQQMEVEDEIESEVNSSPIKESDSVIATDDKNVDARGYTRTLFTPTASQYPNLCIRSAFTLTKTNDFSPTVSSSRVCSTQSIFATQTGECKLTDYSTVVGGVTYVESTVDESKEEVATSHVATLEKRTNPMFDTTLDMTSYESESYANKTRDNQVDLNQPEEYDEDSGTANVDDVIELSSSSSAVSVASSRSSENENGSDSNAMATEEEGDEELVAEEEHAVSEGDSEFEVLQVNVSDFEEEEDEESVGAASGEEGEESMGAASGEENEESIGAGSEEEADESIGAVSEEEAEESIGAASGEENEESIGVELEDDADDSECEDLQVDVVDFQEEKAKKFIDAPPEVKVSDYSSVGNNKNTIIDLDESQDESDVEVVEEMNYHVVAADESEDRKDVQEDYFTQSVPMEVSYEPAHIVRPTEGPTEDVIFDNKTNQLEIISVEQNVEISVDENYENELIAEEAKPSGPLSTSFAIDVSENLPEALLQDELSASEVDLNQTAYASATSECASDNEAKDEYIVEKVVDHNRMSSPNDEVLSLNVDPAGTDRAEDTAIPAEECNVETSEVNETEIGDLQVEANAEILHEDDAISRNNQLEKVAVQAEGSDVTEEQKQIAENNNKTTIPDPIEENDQLVLRVGDNDSVSAGEKDASEENAVGSANQEHEVLDKSLEVVNENEEKLVSPDETAVPLRSIIVQGPTVTESSPGLNVIISAVRNRRKRGASLPPGAQEPAEDTNISSGRTRRGTRAGSVQPTSDVNAAPSVSFSSKLRRNSQDKSSITEASAVDSPQPEQSFRSTRERSVVSDATAKNAGNLDSPASRTRSRLRLSSMDSIDDLDASSVHEEHLTRSRRLRKSSVSSSVSDTLSLPKKKRRTSAASQLEDDGSRMPRPSSVLSNRSESKESTKSTRSTTRSQHRFETVEQPITSISNDALNIYSETRRLTRHQLAILERSAAYARGASTAVEATQPSSSSGRIRTRSTAMGANDSDDAESISSRISNISGVSATRRVTRSVAREMVEPDDDAVSMTSSIGSGRVSTRRAKEISPNTTLAVIEENEPEDTDEKQKARRERKQN